MRKEIHPYPGKKRRSNILPVILMIFLILIFQHFLTNKKYKDYAFSGISMGSTYSVKIVRTSLNKDEVDELKKEIEKYLKRLELVFSDYDKNSELTVLNSDKRVNIPIKVSDELFLLILKSMAIYHDTDKCFDITISPVVDLWGFGEKERDLIPDNKTIQETMARVGLDKISCLENSSIIKLYPGIKLNFNAIAAGYAVDKIADLLFEKQCNNFVIELGGEVLCRGKNAQNGPWKIGVDTPVPNSSPGDKIEGIIELEDRAVSTSGDYRKFHEINGTKYSHIFDPRSGFPASGNVTSVTVVAKTCLEADAYATALFVMGTDEGLRWVEGKEGVEAYFILKNPDNTFSAKSSKGFRMVTGK